MCKDIIINDIPSKGQSETNQEDIDKNFEEFWKDIVCNPDGSIDLEQVKKELFDYSFLMKQASEVYCSLTNGKLSKTTYYSEVIINENDNYTQQLIEEAIEEALEEYQEQIQDLLDEI